MAREDDFTSTVEGAAGWAYAHGRGGDLGDAPSRGEAEADEAYFRGGPATVAPEVRGVRCGACKERHATAGDVRDCYAARDEARAEAQAEVEWEAAGERAFDRALEARAERGGPDIEAEQAEASASDWSWEYQKRWGRAENE